ncbi:hypothetical protein [Pseudomonas sp. Z3-6]
MKFIFARVVGDVVATGRPAKRCHEQQQGRLLSASVRVSEGRV